MRQAPPDGLSCESCLAALSASNRFCPECGTPVSAPATQEMRKTVTLLFTDVTGSTAMGEQLDPEAYRGVMGRYFAVAREAVERHGGTVEKFVGDAVLAVFGVPEVREDDALRAVRAAYELNAGVAALSEELTATLGVSLVIRTGVNTGSVVTGSARAGGSFATGDAVNTAARLEQAAPPGEILLGAETYALVRDAVEVDAVDPIAAKGKSEPLVAHRLIAVLETDTGRTRRMDATLVGRDRETRVLRDALERTLESGRSHLVTVLGAPGIGKSRLVAEFLAGIGDRADVVGGRCVSYGQGITFWPVVQLLRQAVGLAGDESDEVARHALTSLTTDSADGDRVIELLMPLLGQSGVPGDSDQTFWAIRRALEQLASRRPLVVTVDDLHWAEPTLLDLLERVRDEVQDLPLLLVCQARPELLDTHPGWGGGSMNSTTFGLEPFTVDQTASSMTSILGGPVPPDVVREVARWAGGNPLFVEEITGYLVEIGLLVPDDSSWRVTGDLSQARIPPTVAALLAARLDRLPTAERHLLERVSVIGLEFTTDEATALANDEPCTDSVPALLRALSRRDLLRRVRGAHGDSWAFRHIMIREAAYESLPKSVRSELHERFADRIKTSATTAGAERHAFSAHHLERAAQLRRELGAVGPEVDHLVRRAVLMLALAGEEGRDREDMVAAESLFRRAIVLDAPDAGTRRRVLFRLAQLLDELWRVEDTRLALEQLDVEMDETASKLEHALLRCLQLHNALQASADVDPAEVLQASMAAAELARAAGDHQFVVQALGAAVSSWAMLARWAEVRDVAARIRELGSPQDVRCTTLMAAGVTLYGPGSIREVADLVENTSDVASPPGEAVHVELLRAIALAGVEAPNARSALEAAWCAAEELPGGMTVSHLNFAGKAYSLAGANQEAITTFAAAIELCRKAGDLSHASTLLAWQAMHMLEEDEPLESVRPLLDEASACTSPHDVMSVAYIAAVGCIIASREGDHARAAELAREAARVVDLSDQVWQQADLRRSVSEAARLRGDVAEERRLLEEALGLYRIKELGRYIRLVEKRLAEL